MAATSICDHSGIRRKMPSLPNDIIIDEILPILPPESLMRFKCTSVAYNTLISSPEFIDLHLQKSISSDTNRVLIITGKNNSDLYSIDVDSRDPATTIVEIPLPDTLDEWLSGTISIVGSFNGLLCVALLQGMWNFEYIPVLINSSTGVYREIPQMETPILEGEFWVSFGFGFDDTNNDYKLVRVYQNAPQYDYYDEEEQLVIREVMVFSLNENKWKLVESVHYPIDSLEMDQNGVLMKNSLLHWVFRDDGKYRICCFDVRIDEWVNDVPLMDLLTNQKGDFDEENRDKEVNVADLEVLYGCLCVSTITNLFRVVWIMKEYGVKDSWVKLFELPCSFGPCYFRFYGPLGFRKGSSHEVLARKEGGSGLFWCDIKSETYSRTEEINGIPDFGDACFFKGSLVPIPGGEKIMILPDEDEMNLW